VSFATNGSAAFLTDDTAVDVSRVTGIPWRYAVVESRGVARPYLDLLALDWWDQFRVAWTLVTGYALTENWLRDKL
jgi:hypothetical protein